MRLLAALPALYGAVALAASADAAPGGQIATLPVGLYQCELPGDATGPSRIPVPEENFWVRNASSYEAEAGSGSYLLTGNRLTMTSGPKRGEKYRRLSNNFLRKLDPDGKESSLRCVRRTAVRD